MTQDEPHEFSRGTFLLSSDKTKLDLKSTLRLLRTTHWGAGMSLPLLEKAVSNSVCFGVYCNGQQIGFGRVISDLATYAYLTDFVIAEEHRGTGLGKWLVECVLAYPDFQQLRRIALVTLNALNLYGAFGFKVGSGQLTYMELRDAESISNEYHGSLC